MPLLGRKGLGPIAWPTAQTTKGWNPHSFPNGAVTWLALARRSPQSGRPQKPVHEAVSDHVQAVALPLHLPTRQHNS